VQIVIIINIGTSLDLTSNFLNYGLNSEVLMYHEMKYRLEVNLILFIDTAVAIKIRKYRTQVDNPAAV
jgi:hypothetical protein